MVEVLAVAVVAVVRSGGRVVVGRSVGLPGRRGGVVAGTANRPVESDVESDTTRHGPALLIDLARAA